MTNTCHLTPGQTSEEDIRKFFANLEKSTLDNLKAGIPVLLSIKTFTSDQYEEYRGQVPEEIFVMGYRFVVEIGEPAVRRQAKSQFPELPKADTPTVVGGGT